MENEDPRAGEVHVPTATRPSARASLLGHPLVRLVIEFVAVAAAVVAVQLATKPLASGDGPAAPLARATAVVLSVAAALAVYAALVRWLERRPLSELSSRGAGAELALGAATGGGLLSIVVGVLWLAGAYRVEGTGTVAAVAAALGMSLASGVTEEIVFRAVVFRHIEDQFGTWSALAASAAIFGFVHLSNPHSSWWAACAIAIEAGILLGAGYLLTRRLWFVMGLHFAWNFTQAGVFGVPVSGGHGDGLLRGVLNGPPLLSGGEFGVEASLVAFAVCATAGLVLAWLAHGLGRFLGPRWRRRAATQASW